jgi:outer membrane protein assembly factor BamB/tetratricopeptide (TPR) repeat protein
MDRKDHARARELCDRAIENVPESTELRSLKARVCLEEDDQQAAIQAYEALAALYERQGNLQAAISTYRNIVHLDASRVDLRQRIRSMQERSQQKKKETQYRLAGYAALAVCILIFVGGIGLEVRARMRLTEREESLQKTLDQAREADSPRVRLELLKEEAAEWRTYQAGPSITDLSFRAETNQNRVKEALRLAEQEIESIHDTVRNRDLDALERAEALLASGEEQSRGEALGILRRLSERTPPSDITERAQARLNQTLAARTEANALYERLQTEALPVEERFELARRLVEEFPNTVYSHSVRLPVRLRVTPALNARVRLGGVPAGRISPQQPEVLLEVPPFEPFTVSIIRPGFGNEEGVTTWTDTKYRRPTKEVTLQRTVRWRRERLLAGRVEGAPALAPDGSGSPVLVVASGGGDVIGLDLAAGTTRWEFAGAEETLSFQATPFVDDGTVLLPDSTGRILRIRASDGERLSPKREPLDTALTGAALFTKLDFYGGRLCCVAGTQEGAVVCLDVERNRMVWHKPYQTGVVDPIGQQAAHVGDFLYITTPDGKLHTLRGDGQAESVRQVARGFLAGPTSDADGFYTVSAEGRLAAWQARREPVQRWQSPPICPPHTVAAPILLRDRIVFVGTDQGCVAAASAEGGKILWRNHEIPAGLTGPLHHTGDELLAPAGKTVISLDPALGTERWRLTASSGPVKGITSSRNHIAFVDQRGSVYVLDKDRDPE